MPLLLFLSYAIKLVSSLVLRISFSWRETLAGGMLLSSRLSLIIAIAAIGLDLGSIDQAANSAIILVALITCTASPMLFNRIVPPTPITQQKFVIVGAGKQPRLLAQRIAKHGGYVLARPPADASRIAPSINSSR